MKLTVYTLPFSHCFSCWCKYFLYICEVYFTTIIYYLLLRLCCPSVYLYTADSTLAGQHSAVPVWSRLQCSMENLWIREQQKKLRTLLEAYSSYMTVKEGTGQLCNTGRGTCMHVPALDLLYLEAVFIFIKSDSIVGIEWL